MVRGRDVARCCAIRGPCPPVKHAAGGRHNPWPGYQQCSRWPNSLRSQLRSRSLFKRLLKSLLSHVCSLMLGILRHLLHTTVSAPCCWAHHARHRQHRLKHAQPIDPEHIFLLQRSCRGGLTVVNMKKDIHPKFYEEAKVGPSSNMIITFHRDVCTHGEA